MFSILLLALSASPARAESQTELSNLAEEVAHKAFTVESTDVQRAEAAEHLRKALAILELPPTETRCFDLIFPITKGIVASEASAADRAQTVCAQVQDLAVYEHALGVATRTVASKNTALDMALKYGGDERLRGRLTELKLAQERANLASDWSALDRAADFVSRQPPGLMACLEQRLPIADRQVASKWSALERAYDACRQD